VNFRDQITAIVHISSSEANEAMELESTIWKFQIVQIAKGPDLAQRLSISKASLGQGLVVEAVKD